MKVHNTWLNAQKTLQSKREQEAKLQLSGKVDKLPLVQDEIHDVSAYFCVCNHGCVVTMVTCMFVCIVVGEKGERLSESVRKMFQGFETRSRTI